MRTEYPAHREFPALQLTLFVSESPTRTITAVFITIIELLFPFPRKKGRCPLEFKCTSKQEGTTDQGPTAQTFLSVRHRAHHSIHKIETQYFPMTILFTPVKRKNVKSSGVAMPCGLHDHLGGESTLELTFSDLKRGTLFEHTKIELMRNAEGHLDFLSQRKT